MARLRSIEGLIGSAAEVDADLDSVAFFKMSSASAEQVTLQIRSMMERAWEYIAIAYQGRAHLALGYESWDEYVDDRLGDLRLTVPREQRGAVVQSLSRAQMSLRAIAKVLGVSVATAYRDLAGGTPEGFPEGGQVPIAVQGRDGKQYRKRGKVAVISCSICGETHAPGVDECPWDLFAQGRGPRPSPVPNSLDGHPATQQSTEAEPEASASLNLVRPSIIEALTRAVCIVDELDVLPELVDEIELAGGSHDAMRAQAGLAARVSELIDHLKRQSEAMARLVRRLERFARTERSLGSANQSRAVLPICPADSDSPLASTSQTAHHEYYLAADPRRSRPGLSPIATPALISCDLAGCIFPCNQWDSASPRGRPVHA